MKLKVTEKRIQANRKNSVLGHTAWSQKQSDIYTANPSYCKQCNIILPQTKKRNKFCSTSCSAIFNNASRIGVEKIPRHPCAYCSAPTLSKYCSVACSAEGSRKYKDPVEAEKIKRNRVREISANYRAKVKNQTPIDADRKAMQKFYADCPKGYEVDHIIPISKGGLHSLENLQYLTITENRRKSNKL